MRFMTTLTKLVVGMSRLGDHLLKRKASGIVVAALAFACGAGLAYGLKAKQPPKQTVTAAAAPDCSDKGTYSAPPPVAEHTPADEFDLGDSPELQAWKNQHNGTPLPLDYGPDWDNFGEPKVVVLPSGRMLAAAGNSLYMLDAEKRVIWEYEAGWVLDFAYVRTTGLIYVTAVDNNMYIVDAATGDTLYSKSRNGSAGYGAVIPYGDDACIVMDAFGGYRAHLGAVEPMPDGATAWRGTRMLWHVEVPPDARLQVVGSKVYAVTKTKTRLLVRELKVPKR